MTGVNKRCGGYAVLHDAALHHIDFIGSAFLPRLQTISRVAEASVAKDSVVEL